MRLLFLFVACILSFSAFAGDVAVVENGISRFVIYAGTTPDEGVSFAVSELQKYIQRMSGARLTTVSTRSAGTAAIVIGAAAARESGINVAEHTKTEDGFIRLVDPNRIVLAGNSRRATLYAVYDLLEALGCRWFAPEFASYGGNAEFVPKSPTLTLAAGQTVRAPTSTLRYKRVEEGHSHNTENLKQLIAWMGKTRHNAFNCPIDYAHEGRAVWDKWRQELVPELRKRGILIDIGGHGYENFLPPAKYAADHPDWYGMLDGKREPDMHKVNFNTANAEAVKTFIGNIRQFLRDHPEVDILTLLPPDTAQWDTSPESLRLGNIAFRHALLINQVVEALRAEFPKMRYLLHAYQGMVIPPSRIQLDRSTLVSLSPIRRQDSEPILKVSEQKNLYYLNYLWQWLDSGYEGPLGFGPYYSRYAWRSLPVIQPRVIAADTRYLALNGVTMGGSYSEPGSWFTYEINHYAYGKLMWDARADVDGLLRDYSERRFGSAAQEMNDLIFVLEAFAGDVTRSYANYKTFFSDNPFPELKVQKLFTDPFAGYRRHMLLAKRLLASATEKAGADPAVPERLAKWSAMLRYLELELDAKSLAEGLSSSQPSGRVLARLTKVYQDIEALLQAHKGQGLFLTEDPRTRYWTAPRSASGNRQ